MRYLRKQDLFRLAPDLAEKELEKIVGESETSFRLFLYIQPGAKKSEVAGVHGDALKIRIKAPPVDGKANEEVINFLAEHLGIAKSRLAIASGPNSRRKTVRISKD